MEAMEAMEAVERMWGIYPIMRREMIFMHSRPVNHECMG